MIKSFKIYENDLYILNKTNDYYDDIINNYGIKNYNKISSEILEACEYAIETFKNKIELFDDIKLIFVNKTGDKNTLARFISGSSTSTPIIILNDKNIIKSAKEYDVPIDIAVETTIYHELGHAICELEYELYGYQYLEYGNEEEWVEDFAYDLYEYGTISNDLEEFIKNYNKEK